MLKRKRPSHIDNEKGMAMFEMIPILVVIILLVNFALGFFGAIHTGILNSIAARNYAFATFNHRANLTYIRNTTADQLDIHYEKKGVRLHGVHGEQAGTDWVATLRKIDIFDYKDRAEVAGSKTTHNQEVATITESQRNEKVGVNPIWIKTSYGMCLNASCAPQN